MANNIVKLEREKESIEHNTFSSLLKLTNNIVKQYIKRGTWPNGCENLSIKYSGASDIDPMFVVSFNDIEEGDGRWLRYNVITFRVDHSTDTSIFMYSRFGRTVEKEYEYFVKSRRCDVLSYKYLFNGHITEFQKGLEKKTSFSFKDKTDGIIQSLIDLQSKTREELKRHKAK